MLKNSYSLSGHTVSELGIVPLSIYIENQRIKEFQHSLNEKADLFYSEEYLIFPGMIDLHVHAREDHTGAGLHKESFFSAAEAARNGGVTLFCDMPNTPSPVMTESDLQLKRSLSSQVEFPIYHFVALGPSSKKLEQPVAYKLYMASGFGPMKFDSLSQIDELLANFQGETISIHAEDEAILEREAKRKWHHERRPLEAELKALQDIIPICEKYKIRANFCHLSSRESVLMVTEAKKRGAPFTSEVAPHHLFTSYEEIHHLTTHHNVNPPLRTKSVREELLETFLRGEVDFLATDHAPHSFLEKEKGASGFIGLDHYASAVMKLLLEENLKPELAHLVTSKNSTHFLRAYGLNLERDFHLGSEAIFTVVSKIRSPEQLFSKSSNLPQTPWLPFHTSKIICG